MINSNYLPSDQPEGNTDGSDDFDDSETDIENKVICEVFENP